MVRSLSHYNQSIVRVNSIKSIKMIISYSVFYVLKSHPYLEDNLDFI